MIVDDSNESTSSHDIVDESKNISVEVFIVVAVPVNGVVEDVAVVPAMEEVIILNNVVEDVVDMAVMPVLAMTRVVVLVMMALIVVVIALVVVMMALVIVVSPVVMSPVVMVLVVTTMEEVILLALRHVLRNTSYPSLLDPPLCLAIYKYGAEAQWPTIRRTVPVRVDE